MSERGRLEVTIDGNASGFQQVLNAAKQHAKQFSGEVSSGIGSSFAGIGKGMIGGFVAAFSASSIKDFLAGIFEQSHEIKEIAEQFDLSTDSVQRWGKALDKSGVSQQTFYRALDTLRAKRQEAREDDKKREGFDSIGLGADALNPAVSDEEMLKKILGSGASRPQINDLLGRGGSRLKGTVGELGGSSAVYSASDIEDLEKGRKQYKGVVGFFKKLGTMGALEAMANPNDALGGTGFLGLGKFYERVVNRMRGKETPEAKKRREELEADEKRQAAEDAAAAEQSYENDKLSADVKKQSEARDKSVEAGERLKEAQRKNMGAGARRKSLQDDLGLVNRKIGRLEPFEKAGEGDETTKLKLLQLKTQREGLLGELAQKPLQLGGADSMAKSGLFSGSALNFATDNGTAKEQLAVLRAIRDNIKKNPFNW